jgi:hypothetical protein
MVSGYSFEEEALFRMRARAESGFGYTRDLRPDMLTLLDAVEAILARDHPSKLAYADGYVCAVCYDKPWPCPDRAAIREALLSYAADDGRLGFVP